MALSVARAIELPAWTHARGAISLTQPRVMAVVNVTPDSFFDGGRWIAPESASPNVSVILAQCRRLVAAGAAILDLGGESTRPGAAPVADDEELARVLPVVRSLHADAGLREVPISVDTRHAAVARVLVREGAAIVNDISGLADPAMAEVVAESGAGLVIGHLRGDPRTMQERIAFTSLVDEVGDELAAAVARAEAAGVSREHIVVDPGIGFGKDARQSAALVACGSRLHARTGCPVLVGASRKSFLGALTNRPVEQRMVGSVCSALLAVQHGAAILRVHDVAETCEALRVKQGIEDALDLYLRGEGGTRP